MYFVYLFIDLINMYNSAYCCVSGRSFPGGSVVKSGKELASAGDARDVSSIPGLGRFPGEGNYPGLGLSSLLQVPCSLLKEGSQERSEEWQPMLSKEGRQPTPAGICLLSGGCRHHSMSFTLFFSLSRAPHNITDKQESLFPYV